MWIVEQWGTLKKLHIHLCYFFLILLLCINYKSCGRKYCKLGKWSGRGLFSRYFCRNSPEWTGGNRSRVVGPEPHTYRMRIWSVNTELTCLVYLSLRPPSTVVNSFRKRVIYPRIWCDWLHPKGFFYRIWGLLSWFRKLPHVIYEGISKTFRTESITK
jgi:hypothetical protein